MRQKTVVGNWKMHGSRQQAQALLQALNVGVQSFLGVNVVVLPPFVHVPLAEAMLTRSLICWGAQNLYIGSAGAFTGEVSGSMLADYGCRYVLVGHSERRTVFNEDLKQVADKFCAALDAGLQPILCLGETLAQRQRGETEAIIHEQLSTALSQAKGYDLQKSLIAYEPVWAIGTGLMATPQQAQAVHEFIRGTFDHYQAGSAETLSILYGGSVKADNAASLFAMPDVDGSLVGGASLEAQQFLAIIAAAAA